MYNDWVLRGFKLYRKLLCTKHMIGPSDQLPLVIS
jgi:hypothetical protein